MAQGPRHLGESFVSTGLRFTPQTLTAAQQTQVQANLNLPDATANTAALALKADALNAALVTPTVDGVLYSILNKRQLITTAFAITGAALHATNLTALQVPANALILRAVLDVTTKSTSAATVDIGLATASATTAGDSLLDGVDVGTVEAVFDSMDASLDLGANAKAQSLASGKWVTVHEVADTTGMVAKLYITFILK